MRKSSLYAWLMTFVLLSLADGSVAHADNGLEDFGASLLKLEGPIKEKDIKTFLKIAPDFQKYVERDEIRKIDPLLSTVNWDKTRYLYVENKLTCGYQMIKDGYWNADDYPKYREKLLLQNIPVVLIPDIEELKLIYRYKSQIGQIVDKYVFPQKLF